MIRSRFDTMIPVPAGSVVFVCLYVCLLMTVATTTADAQPTVKQALSLVPMQEDVDIDQPPNKNDLDGYEVIAENTKKRRAWVVRDPNGMLLRRFADTNGDNKIDQWCYFRGGIEVYRDIDGDFNEKADQYRWFGTSGLRWGLDPDEDGDIDDWRWISPEEVTAQAVRAVAEQDADLFRSLLIREDELKHLQLSKSLTKQLTDQAKAAQERFEEFARSQQQFSSQTEWADFSAPKPGVLPAGGEHGQQDLVVYDNVIAVVETKGQHAELPIGTLIKIEDRWRLIGLPDGESSGFFYRVAGRNTLPVANLSQSANAAVQKLVEELEKIDQQLAQTASAPPSVHAERSDILRKLIAASDGRQRDMWLTQLVDSVVSSSQADGSVQQLQQLVEHVKAATSNKEVIGQAKFAYLTARYSEQLQASGADLANVQDQWISNLKTFVNDFPQTRPAAEAMLQLAISEEFAGKDDEAIQWYRRIVGDFPDTEMAVKATGAVRRLNSVGKQLALSGKTLSGSRVDIKSLQGNIVLVHYWATWCQPCKQDIAEVKKLLARHRRQRFAVVGVNLDDASEKARQFSKQAGMSWPSLQTDGGLESKLAREMGVFTLPLMLLLDESGKVVNRSITLAELEGQLENRR